MENRAPLAAKGAKMALLLVLAGGPVLLYHRIVAHDTPAQSAAAPQAQPPRTNRDKIREFHRLFYERDSTWKMNRWLGIATVQNPNDVWITQEIISEVKPDLFVEAGTLHGGSAVIWAMILDQVNPQGRVLTIDIEDRVGVQLGP